MHITLALPTSRSIKITGGGKIIQFLKCKEERPDRLIIEGIDRSLYSDIVYNHLYAVQCFLLVDDVLYGGYPPFRRIYCRESRWPWKNGGNI